MKSNTIKNGAMPVIAINSAKIGGYHAANLPNDFGKS
jgi:hypothetical protein